MFYIQVVQAQDKPQSPANKAPPSCKLSEVEGRNHKSSHAKNKTTEYMRNTQQVYYLERRLFC